MTPPPSHGMIENISKEINKCKNNKEKMFLIQIRSCYMYICCARPNGRTVRHIIVSLYDEYDHALSQETLLLESGNFQN